MNLFKVKTASRSAACAGLAVWLVACAGQDTETANTPPPNLDMALHSLANGAAPGSACELHLAAGVTASSDQCPGAGSARALVLLAKGATCTSTLGTLTGAAPNLTAAYQFSSAPPEVQERFCVFESTTGGSAAVSGILNALCTNASVELAMHDCSTNPLTPSPTDPHAFVAPQGQATPAMQAPTPSPETLDAGTGTDANTDASRSMDADGRNICDTCTVTAANTLYVNVPLSMIATTDARMFVRFLNSALPDREILAPAGAQSFTVPNIGVADDAAVRVYAPGQTPPPK